MSPGICETPENEKVNRWHFQQTTNEDKEAGRCYSFMYTGCGGNANNFITELECIKACQSD